MFAYRQRQENLANLSAWLNLHLWDEFINVFITHLAPRKRYSPHHFYSIRLLRRF